MPNLAANLSMMFTEVPFLDRFEAAARAGFRGVEFLFPYADPPEEVARALREAKLENVLFNVPPGDWEAGERGIGAAPGREAEFEAGVETALEYALALGCTRIHAMAGLAPAGAPPAECEGVLVRNVAHAARRLAPHRIDVLVEPINPRDIPGYFVNRQDQALAILHAVGEPNARLQMDLYHCQIVEGDVAMKIRANFGRVAHFQIAGVPERHEPDIGEVHYPYLLSLIDELGFEGWIGCEYRPRAGTTDGLGWAAPYGIGA